jgi:hypothetical protein
MADQKSGDKSGRTGNDKDKREGARQSTGSSKSDQKSSSDKTRKSGENTGRK